MISFVKRIIRWNKLRRRQEPQIELRKKLLGEETLEALEALEQLDNIWAEDNEFDFDKYVTLKAHVVKEHFDVIAIALGTLWELGLSEYDIEELFNICCTSNDSKPIAKLSHGEKGVKGPNYFNPEKCLAEYIKIKETKK